MKNIKKNNSEVKYYHSILYKVLYRSGVEKEYLINKDNAIIGKKSLENIFSLQPYYVYLTNEEVSDLFYSERRVNELNHSLLDKIIGLIGQRVTFKLSKTDVILDLNEIVSISSMVY